MKTEFYPKTKHGMIIIITKYSKYNAKYNCVYHQNILIVVAYLIPSEVTKKGVSNFNFSSWNLFPKAEGLLL